MRPPTPLQERKTVDAEWYTNILPAQGLRGLDCTSSNNGTHGLLLHHDKTIVKHATATLDYLEANRDQLVTQTPYSRGLAPCNFFLFPQVKR